MKHLIAMVVLIIFIPYVIVIYNNPEQNNITNIDINKGISVRVYRTKTKKIETLSLNEYVYGAVASEMPAFFELEALKAQAIASKNYVLRRLSPKASYDVDDTTKYQVYQNDQDLKKRWGHDYIVNSNKIKSAVYAVNNQYLDYQGDIVNTLFFSTSNGYTEDNKYVFGADLPYLKSVKSVWDETETKKFKTETKFNINNFYQKINIPYQDKLIITEVQRNSSNRIISLKINQKLFTGITIRNLLKLKSSDFDMKQVNNEIIINTKGFGHGVGMSQYGANGMAKAGYSYQEILKYYYQGSALKKL